MEPLWTRTPSNPKPTLSRSLFWRNIKIFRRSTGGATEKKALAGCDDAAIMFGSFSIDPSLGTSDSPQEGIGSSRMRSHAVQCLIPCGLISLLRPGSFQRDPFA